MSRRAILRGQAATVLILLCAVGWAHAEEAADECLSKPNGPSPAGSHWYYRVERGTHRQCWYLGPEGNKVHQAQPRRPATPPAARQAQAPKPSVQQEEVNSSTAASRIPSNAVANSTVAATPPASVPLALSPPLLAPRPLLQLSDALSSQAQATANEAAPSAVTGVRLPARPGADVPAERPVTPVSNYGDQQDTTDLEEQEEMPLVWPIMAAGEVDDGEMHEPVARSGGALAFITGSLAASFGAMMLWALYLIFAKEPPRRRDDRGWSAGHPSHRQRTACPADARSRLIDRSNSVDEEFSARARISDQWTRFVGEIWNTVSGAIRRSWFAARTSVGHAIMPRSAPSEFSQRRSRGGAESIARKAPGSYQAQAETRRPYRELTAAEELVRAARLARGKSPDASPPITRRFAAVDPSEEPLRVPEWMSARRPQSSRV